MSFWFLATPYSRFPDGIEAAFNLAVEARGLLLKAGVPVFSPIIHSHPVAVRCGIDPLDHSIWLPSEAPILRSAIGLIMLRAESWGISYGMNHEKKTFEAAGKPVIWMDVGVVPEYFTAKRIAAPLDPQSPLIEFLDKCAALGNAPREDRIRSAVNDLRELYPLLTAWLGYGKTEGVLHPCDDGIPWGHHPGGGEWVPINKTPLLAAGLGPAPFYAMIGGVFTYVVHEAPATPSISDA